MDEVQKVPAVLTVVHQLIESNQHLQFILTGSNARKLKQAGADLLGGRALREFKKDYPQARLLMLYGGETRYMDGDVLVLPCETFLIELQEIL